MFRQYMRTGLIYARKILRKQICELFKINHTELKSKQLQKIYCRPAILNFIQISLVFMTLLLAYGDHKTNVRSIV